MNLKKAIVKQSIINGASFSIIYGLLFHSSEIWLSLFFGIFIGVTIIYIYANIALKNRYLSGRDTLSQIKKASVVRFILNICAFGIVIVFYKNINFVALFFSYLATLSAYWFILLKK